MKILRYLNSSTNGKDSFLFSRQHLISFPEMNHVFGLGHFTLIKTWIKHVMVCHHGKIINIKLLLSLWIVWFLLYNSNLAPITVSIHYKTPQILHIFKSVCTEKHTCRIKSSLKRLPRIFHRRSALRYQKHDLQGQEQWPLTTLHILITIRKKVSSKICNCILKSHLPQVFSISLNTFRERHRGQSCLIHKMAFRNNYGE